MDIPTSTEAPDRSLSLELEPEVCDLVKQENARLPSQVQVNAEQIRSSVARLTSNSMSFQKFLNRFAVKDRVADRGHDRSVAEIGLDGASVVARRGELETRKRGAACWNGGESAWHPGDCWAMQWES